MATEEQAARAFVNAGLRRAPAPDSLENVVGLRPRKRTFCLLPDFVPRVFVGPDDFLAQHSLVRVEDPAQADIIISKQVKHFRPEVLALDRLNVLWTKEPFHSLDTTPRIKVGGREIHVFNLYNGNVYTDNYYDLPKSGAPLVRAGELNVPFANKRVVAVMTRKSKSAVVYGIERSLTGLRERIAMEGHSAGFVDIYGAGWPEGVSKGESRTERHHKTLKQQILSGYNFNLCFENCSWDYYVTEKLWEAVFGHCLPIYVGSETTMQLPFIDAAILVDGNATIEGIADAIARISEKEFVERLNTLIAAGNRAIEMDLAGISRERTQRTFSSFLRMTA